MKNNLNKRKEEYICIVNKVMEGKNSGEHGDYAFAIYTAYNGDKIPITFSCEYPTWKEIRNPSEGDVVILEKVHQKRMKNDKLVWVAQKARLRELEE